MKIADVVDQLAKIVPQETDFLSTIIGISSITSNGGTVSVTTDAPHNLVNGEFVNVRDVETKNSIVSVDFSVVNGLSILEIATFVPHDITLNPREPNTVYAELVGFTDPAWNGMLELIAVPNRTTFRVVNGTEAEPLLMGSEAQVEIVLGKFNGPQTVTIVDPTNFTYPCNYAATGQNGTIHTKINIAGVVDFQRALDQYTRKIADKFFMFVLAPTSTNANKSRGSQTDINNEHTQQSYFNESLRDGFIILVVANVTDEPGAVRSMDNIRDEVFKAILMAVRGFKFPSGLACAPNQVANFLSHGTLAYDNARYVHQFIFEMPLVMTIDDSLQPETRAFRDVSFSNSHPDNSLAPQATIQIDLDEEEANITGTVRGDIGQLNGAFAGFFT